MTSQDQEHPKVFVSHASEDKDRFVLKLALQLRRRGIDAWVDQWEMLPGDSLVDKIFEEGLREAGAIIVVLSSNSVEKPWVREELNAAFIARLDRGTKLIPVVLDDVEVPEALKSTIWQSIPDLENYDDALDRITSAAFGTRTRPPLGAPPKFMVEDLPSIYRLAESDVLTFREFGRLAVETGEWICVMTEEVWELANNLDVTRRDFLEALEMLSDRGWLEPSRELAAVPPYFTLTVPGLEEYLTRFHPEYPKLFTSVVALLLNSDQGIENTEIIESLGAPKILVDHVIRKLGRGGRATISEAAGGYIRVDRTHPSLRRWFESRSPEQLDDLADTLQQFPNR